MEVHFISSLTPEDEAAFAAALVEAAGAFLDRLPIAYVLRIETGSRRIFERSHAVATPSGEAAAEIDSEGAPS